MISKSCNDKPVDQINKCRGKKSNEGRGQHVHFLSFYRGEKTKHRKKITKANEFV